ncbi:MAG TPA: hypothetical protein VFC51_14710 [Chloroflexota bacterium]|nr:hypothetical protein [Chloroflexota bacterium]
MAGQNFSGSSSQWDDYADRIRQQLPTAPDSLTDAYVAWAPWIAMIFGAFGVFMSIVLLTVGAIFSPLLLLAGAWGIQAGAAAFLALVFLLVGSALDVVGGYFMRQMRLNGWWLVAAGLIVGILQNVVHFSVIGLVIVLAISYIHVEVKPRYH